MNLGIIAHNSKKVLIEDFCIAYLVEIDNHNAFLFLNLYLVTKLTKKA